MEKFLSLKYKVNSILIPVRTDIRDRLLFTFVFKDGTNFRLSGMKSIPLRIRQLTNLKELTVERYSNNKVQFVPIDTLKNLQALSISGIPNLPKTVLNSISKLNHLKSLVLIDDSLIYDDLEDFKVTPNLNELYLGHNELTSIPDFIKNLSNLTILDLSSNGFVSIPSWMSNLSQLRSLNLYHNALGTTNDIDSILGLPLRELNISLNNLSEKAMNKLFVLQTLTMLYTRGNGRVKDFYTHFPNLIHHD